MKRLIFLILSLVLILSACAAPAQPNTPAELPEGLLFTASLSAYGIQKERLYETPGEFDPIADTENLALSASVPVYLWENGALQKSEQTRWLMLADGGVIGEANWPPPEDFRPAGSTEFGLLRMGFEPYSPRSFDRLGEEAVALMNQCLTEGVPIAFVHTELETWLLHGKDATRLNEAYPGEPFADAETLLKAAKGLSLAKVEAVYPFCMATWEEFYYQNDYDRFVYPYAHLELEEQIRAELLSHLISTRISTEDLFLAEPVALYTARDGTIKEEPLLLRPVFSGQTCIGYARIYKDRLLQLRLLSPMEKSTFLDLMSSAYADGKKVALLNEREGSYLLMDDSAKAISQARPQMDRDSLGGRDALKKAAADLPREAITLTEEIRLPLSLPDRDEDPMAHAATVYFLLQTIKTGQEADLSGLCLGQAIPMYTYGKNEQLSLDTTALVPLLQDEKLIACMYWSTWREPVAAGILWADQYPETIAALQRAYDTGAECCIIDDAQQRWLVCGDEALIATRFASFDQVKACFESADIVAIAAQYVSRAALSPTRALTP